MRVAPRLRDQRGPAWRRIVDRAIQAPEASREQLAFTLLFVRLSGCLTCHADSYRAMRGCTSCALQAVRRFRGEDQELVEMYQRAQAEVTNYLKGKTHRRNPPVQE